MIAATTGVAATEQVVERVCSHTEGNPLYVREIARLLSTDGRLPEVGDRLAVPRDVREIVLGRTRQLPEECGAVLTLAAVVGRDFPLDLMTHMRGADVVERLEPAIQAGLIISGAPGELRFSHAVVSEALYDATPPAQRMQLHCEIAETMEKHHAAIAAHRASIAHHYLLALPFAPAEKAVEAAQRCSADRRGATCVRRRCRGSSRAQSMRLAPSTTSSGTWSFSSASVTRWAVPAMPMTRRQPSSTRSSSCATLDAPQLFAQAALGYAGQFVWLRAGRRHSGSYRCFARRSNGSRTTTAGSGCGCSRGSRARCVTTCRRWPRARAQSRSCQGRRTARRSVAPGVRAPGTLVCDLGA